MTCFYCRTTFYHASQGGPAEDCDCGRCATVEQAREDRQEAIDATAHDERETVEDM